jgi:glycosyltransferase involved in cell wall biosynthesis
MTSSSAIHEHRPGAGQGELGLRVSVLLPTYRRPEELRRCLEGLKAQIAPPAEVIVVVREQDQTTERLLAGYDPGPMPLRLLRVTEPGQVAALNAALDVSQGDIVAFTDDDAVPRPDWLARIRAHFLEDARLGGVGGRDWMHSEGRLVTGQARTVGHVSWFGRPVGNHHLGGPPAREVEILKGVNMSFRRLALDGIRFDRRLKGSGAQVHNDWAVCIEVRRRGWKLLYDSLVAVDHYLAPRGNSEDRLQRRPSEVYDVVFNESLLLLESLPGPRRVAFVVWSWLVGTRLTPGLLQVLRARLHGRSHPLAVLGAASRARLDALAAFRRRGAP